MSIEVAEFLRPLYFTAEVDMIISFMKGFPRQFNDNGVSD
jgi:hypothetical protein